MHNLNKTLGSFIILILFANIAYSQFDGYVLYNLLNQNTSYLINANQDIEHTWSNEYNCNYSVLLMDSGNIMRGGVYDDNQIDGSAVGGIVQEIDPDGNVVWEFIYSTSNQVSHHDITLMPNGGVLLIAWEIISNFELAANGFTGKDQKHALHIIEVQPDGNGGGEIVWEWHLLDHLIQYTDPNKPNYGIISHHPERLNINVETSSFGWPNQSNVWIHTNGIDYNADLDQIVFSARLLSEIFVIDHSTTTEEAASHEGGNAGKGGDFLYRWGNPSNYNTSGNQVIKGAVHDARFIPNDGRPRGGFIQIFNNIGGASSTSVVDAIDAPLSLDGYNYDKIPGEAYGPTEPTWRHQCLDNALGQSASNSLPNGNIFVALSGQYIYEADTNGNMIWQYNAGPAKAFRYTCDHLGIQSLISQGYVDGEQCSALNTNEVSAKEISAFPNPTSGLVSIKNAPLNSIKKIIVTDVLGKIVATHNNTKLIDLSEHPTGNYYLSIHFNNGKIQGHKVSLVK